MAGEISEYKVPDRNCVPYGIVAGADGNIWFTEARASKVSKMTLAGRFTEYFVPNNDSLGNIVRGQGNRLFFGEITANRIGEIDPIGNLASHPAGSAFGGPEYLAYDPENSIWFSKTYSINRMEASGTIHTMTLANGENNGIAAVAVGRDGSAWFTVYSDDKVGNADSQGHIRIFSVPTARSGPKGITRGPDGAMWFTEYLAGKIGRIASDGAITEFEINRGSRPDAIVTGPDGALWFTEYNADAIGRLEP